MKKLIALSAIAFVLLFNGCKKETIENTPIPNPLGEVPASFMQRVILEELTGEWCGSCPAAAAKIETLIPRYGDTLTVISIHDDDFLDILTYNNQVRYSMGQTSLGYPCGAVNRIKKGTSMYYGYSSWSTDISTRKAEDHKTGIAMITSIKGDSAVIKVYVRFLQAPAVPLFLNVYLTETDIPEHNQQGASSGFIHRHVLRNMITPKSGDAITSTGTEEFVKTYTVPITGFVASKLKVVASVAEWGTSTNDRDVYNTRAVKVGETAKWQ